MDNSTGNTYRFNLYFGGAYRWRINNVIYNQSQWASNFESSALIDYDPVVTDTTNEDFSLTENSSAIDNGEDLSGSSYFENDFINTPRPQIEGWDIGAYEFKNPIFLYLLSANLTSPTTLELTFNKSLDERISINKKLFYIDGIEVKNVKKIAENKLELKTSTHGGNKEHIIILHNFRDHFNNEIPPQFRAAFYRSNKLYKQNAKIENKIISYSLDQNYPNPFNPSTTIKYSIQVKGMYSLKIFNVLGQEVKTLYTGLLETGEHNINFNSDKLPSGVYIYQLMGENVNLSKKMLLLK